MQPILSESLYLIQLGIRTHVLKIEELTDESEFRERKFRLCIPSDGCGAGKTICSSSEMEVALQAAEFLMWRELNEFPRASWSTTEFVH